MENLIIVYKSITVANRAKSLMEKMGIQASVIQLPQSFNIKGCSYAVKIKKRDKEKVLELSDKFKLKIRAVFEEENEHDISW